MQNLPTPQRDPNIPESLKAILRRRQEEADQAKWESMKEDQQYDKFVKQQQEADPTKWNVEMPEPKSSSLDAGDCGQFQNINLEESS